MPELRNRLAQLSPLFIWSPVARCGITLLQRLVSSSREVLVYGENSFFLSLLPHAMLETQSNKKQAQDCLDRMVAGDFDFWTSNSNPSHEHYARALIDSFYSLVHAYEKSTTDLGISRWGVKSPIGSIEFHLLIAKLLPRAQHLYIYRHPEAVLRSQKARNWLPTLKNLQLQSEKWANHLNYFLQIQDGPNHLVLRYEELLANQEAEAKKICEFLNISSVDMSTFDKKINTFVGPDELGYSPTGYIAPKPLTPEEFEAMVEIVRPIADAIGYSLERENA